MTATDPASSDVTPDVELSLIIPCYNEITRLPRTMKDLVAYLAEHTGTCEIVIVDDGSKDDTAEWVRNAAQQDDRIRLVTYGGNRGKGYAVRQGMLTAKGRYRLFMDADGSTPVSFIGPFLETARDKNIDIAIGSRKEIGAQLQATQNLPRRVASSLFGWLTRLFVVYGVKDTQCGFKLFSDDAVRDIFARATVDGAIFDIELMLLAARARYRVAELPVAWAHDEDSRLTYNLRKSLMIFIELMRVKLHHRIWWPQKVTCVTG